MAAPKKLTETEIQKVALLYAQGKSQGEIVSDLDLSQPTVSRARQLAIGKKWLIDKPRCKLPVRRIAELEQLIHAPGLLKHLQQQQPASAQHLWRLRILDPPAERGTTLTHWFAYRDAFGHLAAQHLMDEVLPSVRTMGVTWGGTLLATLEGLEHALRPPGLAPVEFFPVCGSPPEVNVDAMRSSSYLVSKLDKHVNRGQLSVNNFTGVSAAISKHFDRDEEQVLKRYFRENQGYRNVFGDGRRKGLMHSMDAVITSVGTTDPQEDAWLTSAAQIAGITERALIKASYGNIGGVFLARPRANVSAVNRRWTGIQLDGFRDCAERAARPERGGTILVALGKKAEVTLECIREGLVSQLIIDPELAVRLGQVSGYKPPRGVGGGTA